MEPEEAGAFETFLAELSTPLTGLPSDRVDGEIEHALRGLVEFLGTDRATLFNFHADSASLRPTHSWARQPVEAYAGPPLQVNYPSYHEQLLRGETLRFERLPDE